VRVGGGPPDRTCIVHHGTDERLEEQCAISDGQTTPPVEEGLSKPNIIESAVSISYRFCNQKALVSYVT
jgi:hypothetical protein